MTDIYQKVKKKVGGYDQIIYDTIELINLCCEGNETPNRILLTGLNGTGKTYLAKNICSALDIPSKFIDCSTLFKKFYLESHALIEAHFRQLEDPSVLVLDNLDQIASKRTSSSGVMERQILDLILKQMETLSKGKKKIFVIGITVDINSLDKSLIGHKRFGKFFHLTPPNSKERTEILKIACKNLLKKNIVLDLEEINSNLHGFLPCDVENLVSHIGQKILVKVSNEVENPLEITSQELEELFRKIKPSSLQTFTTEANSNCILSDLAGIDEIIKQIQNSIFLPIQKPHLFSNLGILPPKGILLMGPKGTGKTHLARAIANESKLNFISVSGTQLISKFVGESEQNLAKLFKAARSSSPCILFLDQFEILAQKRGFDSSSEQTSDRILSCFLTEMDGISNDSFQQELDNHLFILAATNRPDILDPTILRSGRFDQHIVFKLPDENSRLKILEKKYENIPISKETKDYLYQLSQNTNQFSGADLENICRESALLSLRENLDANLVELRHVKEAFKNAKDRKF